MNYRAREFRPGLWHVVDASGHPVYDSKLDGDDRPLIFHGGDTADELASKMNTLCE